MPGDVPDRTFEVHTMPDGEIRLGRILGAFSSVHEDTDARTVRSWFVGPDGLTAVERGDFDYLQMQAAVAACEVLAETVSLLLHARAQNCPGAAEDVFRSIDFSAIPIAYDTGSMVPTVDVDVLINMQLDRLEDIGSEGDSDPLEPRDEA